MGDYESDAYKIQERISKKLDNLTDGKIGLNYTGGTKAMAVHSYRALFYQKKPDFSYQKRPDVIFSYLDARRLEMCIDREEGERERIKVTPEMISVELKTIFELHGWKLQNDFLKEPHLYDIAKEFANFYHNSGAEAKQLWRSWCNQVFKDQNENQFCWKKDSILNKLDLLKIENLKSHLEIKNILSHLGIKEEQISLESLKEKGKFEKIKHLCKWLDGEWLEHYVLGQISEIENYEIAEKGISFDIATTQKPKDQKFEFDVAFMQGYQLFAISCTTDDTKQLCKSKLFEAYIRARQLGGDEARIALVCCVSKKDQEALETEIINVFNSSPESGQRDYRIVVFGREDLPDLSQKIAKWIKDVE